MSWQAYIDDQLLGTKMVKNAVICGHDGNIWAKSADFNVTDSELSDICNHIGDTAKLAANGVRVAGQKYMFLSCTDKIVRAKHLSSGIHIVKTNQAVIVCTYEAPQIAESTAVVTEKLADYLVSVGY